MSTNFCLRIMSQEFWIIFLYINNISFTTIQNFPKVPDKSWTEKWALQTFGYGYSIEIRRLCMLRAACLLNNQWNLEKYRSDLNRGMTERFLHELMVFSMISKENKMMIMCWDTSTHIQMLTLTFTSVIIVVE